MKKSAELFKKAAALFAEAEELAGNDESTV